MENVASVWNQEELWWQGIIQDRFLEEDWNKKNFRKNQNEFMKLVDHSLHQIQDFSIKKGERKLKECAFFDCLRRSLLS